MRTDKIKRAAFERMRGVNSEVSFSSTARGEPAIVKRLGAKKGEFSREEAESVAADVLAYHSLLVKAGVPVPEVLSLSIEVDPITHRASIVKTMRWKGEDLTVLIASHSHEEQALRDIIGKMVRTIEPLLRQHIGFELPVGIDAHVSNFTLHQDALHFVDIFPPRFRKNGRPIVEWPAPKSILGHELGFFKHFDLRGVMLVMSAQLARIAPRQKAFLESVLLEAFAKIVPKELAEMQAELEQSPWIRIRALLASVTLSAEQLREAVRIIKEAPHTRIFGVRYNVYALREIALELASAGSLTEAELEAFFQRSHFEDELSSDIMRELTLELQNALEAREKKR